MYPIFKKCPECGAETPVQAREIEPVNNSADFRVITSQKSAVYSDIRGTLEYLKISNRYLPVNLLKILNKLLEKLMDILDNAAELFENSLARLGIDKETARCETTGIICELAFLFGGQLVYIKKTRNPNAIAELNSRIAAEYDRNNSKDLARKYQLSQAVIYQIVKAAT